MLGNEGEPLSSISERKANWFLKRNLAVEIPPLPGFERSIQLTFQHQKVSPPSWSTLSIPNQCVICGNIAELTLHHVVPYVFRRQMPEIEKDHSRQWCVLLCVEHHIEAETRLFDIYGKYIPKYLPEKHSDTTMTLIRLKAEDRLKQIPADRLAVMLARSSYQTPDEIPITIPSELKALRQQVNVRNSHKHLAEVNAWAAKFIEEHGGIQGTKELFRNAFMELQPKYLPQGYLDF